LDKIAENSDHNIAPRLLPLPARETLPNWTTGDEKYATKLDLNNLKLNSSKASLLSAMDKIVRLLQSDQICL
jgi:hypothetical protein